MTQEVHQFESKADDSRRQIELFLYEKSLLPETRRDLLLMVETLDRIPNRADCIAFMYLTQKTAIFPGIVDELRELMKLSIATFEVTAKATLDCFGKMSHIREASAKC